MFEVKLPKKSFENIKYATINFISKSFNDNDKILNENELIKKF